MEARGSVFKYGDNIDTDVIIPARYLNTQNARELADRVAVLVFGALPAKQPGKMPQYAGVTALPLYSCIVPVPPRQPLPGMPGLPLLLALALAFYCLWRAQVRGDTHPAAKHLYTATGFAVLTLVLSLHAFPWDFVEGWFGPAVGKVVGMFQFPFRFLSLGTLLLCAAALFALQLLPERRSSLAAAGLVCAALLTASITETNIMSAQGESSYATYSQNTTINSVGTAEYLIDGASSYEAIWAQPKPASGDLHLISYEKRKGVVYVSVENDGGEAAIYGNYYAADESGAPFAITSGENMRIVLTIPAGYTGTIHVRYHAPGYWRAFEALSAVSLLGVIGCGAFVRRKRRTPATV